jgi:hypothetical protein
MKQELNRRKNMMVLQLSPFLETKLLVGLIDFKPQQAVRPLESNQT